MAILTAAVVQKQPKTLLDFFELKNGGRNPQSINETLQPTIDLLQMYRETNSIVGVNGPLAVATGDFDFLAFGGLVPQTEGWYVLNYSIRCVCPAGSVIDLQATCQKRAGGGSRAVIPVGLVAKHSIGVGLEIVVATSNEPFFMPPDSLLGGVCLRTVGAGPFNVNLSVEFVSARL